MWLKRVSLLTMFWWQLAQSLACDSTFSCLSPLGLWMLWHDTHDTLRASCLLLAQNACALVEWHDVQAAEASTALTLLNCIGFTFSGSSACLLPGPWQDSQPLPPAGVRGSAPLL